MKDVFYPSHSNPKQVLTFLYLIVHDYCWSLETIPGGPVITNYYAGPPGLTFLYFINLHIIAVHETTKSILMGHTFIYQLRLWAHQCKHI